MSLVSRPKFLIQISRIERGYLSRVHVTVVVNIWECYPLTHQKFVLFLTLPCDLSNPSTMWYITITLDQSQIMP